MLGPVNNLRWKVVLLDTYLTYIAYNSIRYYHQGPWRGVECPLLNCPAPMGHEFECRGKSLVSLQVTTEE